MTKYRRRQWRDKRDPGMQDLTIAFSAGVCTATLLALFVYTFFLGSPC